MSFDLSSNKVTSFGEFRKRYQSFNPGADVRRIERKYNAALSLMFGDPRDDCQPTDAEGLTYVFPADPMQPTEEFLRLDVVGGCNVLPEWMHCIMNLLLTESELSKVPRKPVWVSKRFGHFIFGGCAFEIKPPLDLIHRTSNWISELIWDEVITTDSDFFTRRPVSAVSAIALRRSTQMSQQLADRFSIGEKPHEKGKGFYGFVDDSTCMIAIFRMSTILWDNEEYHARILAKDVARKKIYMFDPHGHGNFGDGVLTSEMTGFLEPYDKFDAVEFVNGPTMQDDEGSCVLQAYTRAIYLAFQYKTNPGGDVRFFLTQPVPCVFPVFVSNLIQKGIPDMNREISTRNAYSSIKASISSAPALPALAGGGARGGGPVRPPRTKLKYRNPYDELFAKQYVESIPAYRDNRRTGTMYVVLPVQLLVACIDNLSSFEPSTTTLTTLSRGYIPPAWPISEVKSFAPTRAMRKIHEANVEDEDEHHSYRFVTAYLRQLDATNISSDDERELISYVYFHHQNAAALVSIPIVFTPTTINLLPKALATTVVMNVGRLNRSGEEVDIVNVALR